MPFRNEVETGWEWFSESFARLPGSDDSLFQALWPGGRLRFERGQWNADAWDEHSARLVSAAVKKHAGVFISLPDARPHRPAMLFATALLRHWQDERPQDNAPYREVTGKSSPILYFGSSIGIREHLERTFVGVGSSRLCLGDVFRSESVGRSGTPTRAQKGRKRVQSRDTDAWARPLPRVVTIYAPADPAVLLRQHQPSWVAVDCGDAAQARWLPSLLDSARAQGVPVIAWSHNPLSGYIENFLGHDASIDNSSNRGFVWPMRRAGAVGQPVSRAPATLWVAESTQLQALLLEGNLTDEFSRNLRDATRTLARAYGRATSSFALDAVSLHWRLLRAVENLCVPLELHEAQVKMLWGIKSFAHLQSACTHFREAALNSSFGAPALFAANLESVGDYLESALRLLAQDSPPLWKALSALCIQEHTQDNARLLIFASHARKQMFLWAMLARFNMTLEDMRRKHIYTLTLDEMRRLSQWGDGLATDEDTCNGLVEADSQLKGLEWHPLLVGLPSPTAVPKIGPVLLESTVDILLYPHQRPTLIRQHRDWNKRLTPDLKVVSTTLAAFNEMAPTLDYPELTPRLQLREPLAWEVESSLVPKLYTATSLWEELDLVEEIAHLMRNANEDELGEVEESISAQSPQSQASGEDEIEIWCQQAVDLHLSDGWRLMIASDETVYVVSENGPSAPRTDERYARSIQAGDRLLLIYGQRRQSLYDLIISRVHCRPEIELHLALIRRWHSDFVTNYAGWNRHGSHSLDELLRQMQSRGSKLTTSITLRHWLAGMTMCPDDPDDLRRLAEVLDMNFVRDSYRQIERAATRLSTLHRGLGRRLSTWLQHQLSGASQESNDDVLDAALGLRFSDFRNSLLLLQVREIHLQSGLFLRDNLGRLERIQAETQ